MPPEKRLSPDQIPVIGTIGVTQIQLASAKIIVGDAGGVAAAVSSSGDLTNDNAGVFTIGAQKIDGTNMKNNADSNVIGSPLLLFRIPVPAGADGNVDVIVNHKIRVVDCHLVKTVVAGTNGTITLKNGADAITGALDVGVIDQALVRAVGINDLHHEIAAGGTMRVFRNRGLGGSGEDCIVYVSAVRVA